MTVRKKVRSQDVADLAGVSRTTVSLVLNGRGDSIPDRTKKKIYDAVDSLGFIPSPAARQLRSGQGKIVLFLAPGWMPSGRADRMWSDISNALDDHGFTCIFSRSAGYSTSLRQLLEELTPRAVISFFTLDKNDQAMLERMGIPLINQFPSAGTDNADTAFAKFQQRVGATQVDFLLSKGAQRIAYLGTDDALGTDILSYRVQGAENRLRQHGMPLAAHYDESLDDDPIRKSIESMREKNVDAICAFNDDYAAAAVLAADKLGLQVPQQLRIIGVDNLQLGRYLKVPLTTIDYDSQTRQMIPEILKACIPQYSAPTESLPDNDIWVVERMSA